MMSGSKQAGKSLPGQTIGSGLPYAPTPESDVTEWLAIAEEILKSKDYYRLADWWSYTCRRLAVEMPLEEVLRRHRRYDERMKYIGWNVYWILNGDQCLYVGYNGLSAQEGIRQQMGQRKPLGNYLRGLQSYDGLRCVIVSLRLERKSPDRKFAMLCRDIEIEKRDPKFNERF